MITLILLGLLLVPCAFIGGILVFFWKARRMPVLRWSAVCYLILAMLILFGAGPYLLARVVSRAGTRPADQLVKATPADYHIAYEDVVFEAQDSIRLRGWLVPPATRKAVIICTHGLFRNRTELLEALMPLARDGYGTLLYDSRSHGTSDKGIVSLGYYERNDVLGAIRFVLGRYRDAVDKPVIVLLGVSMGAVAVLEAAAETRDCGALILDSPFSSLRETVVDHTWLLFKLPRYPFPSLFLFWFQRIAGFDAGRLDSHKAMKRVLPVPLLMIASEGDARIKPAVARQLFAESRASLKRIEIFAKDVPHGAAARIHPAAYSALLENFLAEALGGAGKPAAGP
jgi:pimeloyl-ACP methyl ester carboxylesterase